MGLLAVLLVYLWAVATRTGTMARPAGLQRRPRRAAEPRCVSAWRTSSRPVLPVVLAGILAVLGAAGSGSWVVARRRGGDGRRAVGARHGAAPEVGAAAGGGRHRREQRIPLDARRRGPGGPRERRSPVAEDAESRGALGAGTARSRHPGRQRHVVRAPPCGRVGEHPPRSRPHLPGVGRLRSGPREVEAPARSDALRGSTPGQPAVGEQAQQRCRRGP